MVLAKTADMRFGIEVTSLVRNGHVRSTEKNGSQSSRCYLCKYLLPADIRKLRPAIGVTLRVRVRGTFPYSPERSSHFPYTPHTPLPTLPRNLQEGAETAAGFLTLHLAYHVVLVLV